MPDGSLLPALTCRIRTPDGQHTQLGRGSGQSQDLQRGHSRTDPERGRTAEAEQLFRGRCHPLLFGAANQRLRRRGRTEDSQHPQHGHEPHGRILQRHTVGQRTERAGGLGQVLVGQHRGNLALQRTEKRHLPIGAGVRLVGQHLSHHTPPPVRRGEGCQSGGQSEVRFLRIAQPGFALRAQNQ